MLRFLRHFGTAALLFFAIGAPEAADPPNIYPLGDSITWGLTGPRNTPGGYRGYLHERLQRAGVAHQFVGTDSGNPSARLYLDDQIQHEGHSGYRIDQVDIDLDGIAGAWTDNGGYWLTGTDWRAPIYPDVVVIHLGSNDILQNYDPASPVPLNYGDPVQLAQFVDDMTVRLDALLEKIYQLRPDARIVLSTVVPILGAQGSVDLVTPVYADAIRELAQQKQLIGRRLVLVDAFAAFVREIPGGELRGFPHYYGEDLLHPNPVGYHALAEVFSAGVIAALALP